MYPAAIKAINNYYVQESQIDQKMLYKSKFKKPVMTENVCPLLPAEDRHFLFIFPNLMSLTLLQQLV